MIPASLVPPIAENAWQVLVTDKLDIIRTDTYAGYACDKNNLAEFLESQLSIQEVKPDVIKLRNYTVDPIALTFPDISVSEKNLPAGQLIEDMARWIDKPVINLLQGAYQTKYKKTSNKKIWLWAAYLTSALVALLFLSNIISLIILNHHLNTLDSNIQAIYKKNFPEASAIVAPKERMQAKLNSLSSEGSRNPLLLWMGFIGKALRESPGFRIQQLEFRDNKLGLEFSVPHVRTLDAFVRALTHQGLSIKQQNISVSGTETKGSLVISSGGKV